MDKITKKIITTTDIHKGDIVLCRTHCDSPAKEYGIVWNTDRKFGYIYVIDWQMLTYAIPIGEIYAIYRGLSFVKFAAYLNLVFLNMPYRSLPTFCPTTYHFAELSSKYLQPS